MIQEWNVVKLPGSIIREMDAVIERSEKRYTSRSEFARDACLALLEVEKKRTTIKRKQMEVAAR